MNPLNLYQVAETGALPHDCNLNRMHTKYEFMLNQASVMKKEQKVSPLSPDLERHLEESFKHNDSVLKRLAQM